MNNMRKRNNNGGQRRHGGHSGHGGGHGRRFNNNSNNQGGGNRDHQNLTRQKHHATQMREKYMNHARDAQSNGDRVDVEYYLQHVEHYNRMLADIMMIESERQEKFREQQAAQQATQGGENNSAAEPADNGEGVAPESMEEPINPGNQPRMTRGARHTPRQADHNGSQAANANNEDIPLPGGVIGAV